MPEGSGENSMPMLLKATIAGYLAVLPVALMAGLVMTWPVLTPGTPETPGLGLDGKFLISAALAGALGSCIHLGSSFVSYAGTRNLSGSWAWWYFLRPTIGAALAVVVYFALRAGLVSGAGEAATAAMNPYGVASLCGLSGMFSKQATEKLRDVFENVCATATKPKPD